MKRQQREQNMNNLEQQQPQFNTINENSLPQQLPLAPAYNQEEIKQIQQLEPIQANQNRQQQRQQFHENYFGPNFDSYQPKLQANTYNPMDSLKKQQWQNKKPSEMSDAEYEVYLKQKTISDYKKLIESVLTNPKVSSFEKEQSKNNYMDDPIYRKMYDQRKSELDSLKQSQQSQNQFQQSNQQQQPQQQTQQLQQSQQQQIQQQEPQKDIQSEIQNPQKFTTDPVFQYERPTYLQPNLNHQLNPMNFNIPDPIFLLNENRILQQKLFNSETDYQNLQRKYDQLYEDFRKLMQEKDNAEKQIIQTQSLLINYKKEIEKIQQVLQNNSLLSRPQSSQNQNFTSQEIKEIKGQISLQDKTQNQIDKLLKDVQNCIENYQVSNQTLQKFGLNEENMQEIQQNQQIQSFLPETRKSNKSVNIFDRADKYSQQIQNIVDWIFNNVKPFYIFASLLILHWFSTSGQVFNMINNAPPYNVVPDKSGKEHLEILASGSHNQYSFEGTIAGVLTCLAPTFYIIALRKMHQNKDLLNILVWIMLGTACVALIHFMYTSKR